MFSRFLLWIFLLPSALCPLTAATISGFAQTTLVTSATDPDLINPWGISFSATSPFWVSDNGTGKSTLYNAAGVKQGLIVSMPAAAPVTGQVFNGTASFNGDTFLFAAESGQILGWRGAIGTVAETVYTVAGAVYKGLAASTTKDVLFAANFNSGAIDVFATGLAGPTGSFFDPNAPAGYAPFNIQNIGGVLYVTFAQQDAAKHDDVSGVGHGFVDIFDPVTHTFTRLITGSAAGGTVSQLDSPWGVAIAPAGFDGLGSDLLVGNFGDGKINVFSSTGVYLGTLGSSGADLVNPGLWGITFGNSSANPNALYITAGGANEDVGVFARIDAVPEPATFLPFAFGLALFTGIRRYRRMPGA